MGEVLEYEVLVEAIDRDHGRSIWRFAVTAE